MNERTGSIRRQFNRSAAGAYDLHAHVQRKMAELLLQSQEVWPSEVQTNRPQILEIGCGTGALTEILVNTWPCSVVTALDIAPAMIKAAEQRVLAGASSHLASGNSLSTRVRFIQADIELWAAEAPTASFDLIVSNACFQWLSDPQQTLRNLRRILRAEGVLAFTTFGPDTFYELHQAFDAVYRAHGLVPQRHGISFPSIAQWQSLLHAAGFSSIQEKRLLLTETYASARDFLLSVKAMGASATEAIASRELSSRHLFTCMYKEYEGKFGLPLGGVGATYDLLCMQASPPL